MTNEKKEKRKDSDEMLDQLTHRMMEGAAAETVQRYGSAAKEFYVGYSGHDNEAGVTLSKSLKSISQSKVNPDNPYASKKQQSGFSAEIVAARRKNAQRIINGESTRAVRTDDVGRVNDPLYDLVDVDAKGNIIEGSGSQMKFVGKTPEELLNKMTSRKYQKYLDADAILDIPDDYYEALVGDTGKPGIIDSRIAELETQLSHAKSNGNEELAAQKKAQIDKLKKIRKNVRKSGLTRAEADEARAHPAVSTAKDVGRVAHKAGMNQAKTGAVIAGSTSLVKNLAACIKGEKEPVEAAESLAKDTATGAVVSYANAFSGTVVKGALQNSKSEFLRDVSGTNIPAALVTTTVDIGKTMGSYMKGEIDGTECIEKLGKQGFSQIGSLVYSSICVVSAPGGPLFLKLMSGLVGSSVGYAAAAYVYKELSTSLKEYKMAREERIRVEAECAEAIALIRQYREEMDEIVNTYLTDHLSTFHDGFCAMDQAIMENDVNGFIAANNEIQEMLGQKAQYSTQAEFDELMLSDEPLTL